jgi:L-lysine 6-transaminase
MCAVDLPDGAARDAIVAKCFELGVVILGCGVRSLRFRPPLDVTVEELDEAVDVLRRAADAVTPRA